MAGRIQGALRQGFATLLLTAVALPASTAATDSAADAGKEPHIRAAHSLKQPSLEPEITALAGMAGDVFPALANHLSSEPPKIREFGVVQVRLSNPSSAEQGLRARVTVSIDGWSGEETQNVDLPPGTAKTLSFAPPLSERAFRNREIAPALAQVRAHDSSGNLLFAQSVALKMRASDDMYWGERFRDASMIASWVTPHDLSVEKLLSRAKEFSAGRRLPGYEPWKDAAEQELSTRQQARAIYTAVQRHGLS